MTAYAEIIPPAPSGAHAAPDAAHEFAASRRHDGWTGERQRLFLQSLSEGSSVTHACRLVGLTVQSAYAFRRAARGVSFAIGWQAAQLLCRETLADTLLDRALHGTDHIHFARDGSETHYRRHDNHFALKMLARMDRMANAAQCEATHAAARLAAAEFDQYLELIARDGGPARTGLFLGTRLGAEGVAASNDDLAPVRALARADHWLRTHTDLAEPLATADLDPAQRAGWSAEQWTRAEAAGLVALAPAAAEPPENPKLHQHSEQPGPGYPPVWWDDEAGDWRTSFPPSADFDGEQFGEYHDLHGDYERELSPLERAMMDSDEDSQLAVLHAEESRERDAWFGIAPAAPPAPASAAPSAPDAAPPALPAPSGRKRKG